MHSCSIETCKYVARAVEAEVKATGMYVFARLNGSAKLKTVSRAEACGCGDHLFEFQRRP